MNMTEKIALAQVLVNASVPVLIGLLGWWLNSRLKSIDQAQWQNRKIIELRLDVFKDVSPKLNAMYCYCMYLGDWKQHSPEEILMMKRQADKTMHVHRYMLSGEVFAAYARFIETVFQMFTGTDGDARIQTGIVSELGNRPATFRGEWKEDWKRFFSTEPPAPKETVREDYEAVMEAFRACIGLKPL